MSMVGLGTFAAMGVLAPAAFANHVDKVTANGCSSLTYSFVDFNSSGTNQVTMNVYKADGAGNPTSPAIASADPTFNGPDLQYTIPINGTNGESVIAEADWNSNGNSGSYNESSPFTTITLSCPPPVNPLTYTGRAYDVFAKASLLGTLALLSPTYVLDTGNVSTPSTSNDTATTLTESLPALGLAGGQLERGVVTGGDASVATAGVNALQVGNVDGIPLITTGEVQSSSTTSCSNGKLSESGSTNIVSLTIGATKIKIPDPVPVDDTITIPGVGSVELNEQIPITDGLAVNAIDIRLNTLGLITAQVIIAHSESDLENC
jgi:hypothetical protein